MNADTLKQEMHLAYRRVSTVDQTTARQLDGLGIHFNREYEDKATGGSADRPALQQLLADVGLLASVANVTIHVHSIDRMARNLGDLERLVQEFTSKGASVKFHKEGLQFSSEASPMDKLMLQVMGAFAEFERSMIRERQREGIALAKAVPGKYRGRAPALKPEQVLELKALAQGGTSKTELAKQFGISRASLYNYLAE